MVVFVETMQLTLSIAIMQVTTSVAIMQVIKFYCDYPGGTLLELCWWIFLLQSIRWLFLLQLCH